MRQRFGFRWIDGDVQLEPTLMAKQDCEGLVEKIAGRLTPWSGHAGHAGFSFSYGMPRTSRGLSDAILVDAQQCLGLVPRDVPTARIFVQGLIGVRPRPEPREVFLRFQHLNLQIKSVR